MAQRKNAGRAKQSSKRGGVGSSKGGSAGALNAASFGGASHMLNSRFHAGVRAATLSPKAMLRTLALFAAMLAGLVFLALWLGGHLPAFKQGVSDFKRERLMAVGFTVERIDVMGEGRLNEADVRAAVGIYEGDYFFGADLARAQERTESLPWVDRAVVRRLWPNRIVVQLVETTPYALYQEDGVMHLVSREGEQVAELRPEMSRLPQGLRVFTGPDAATHAAAISEQLQTIPNVWAATQSLTRHPSGRWDVRLDQGTILRLPLGGEAAAFRRYAALQTHADLASQYAIIDMRLTDRLTLTPKPDPKLLDQA